MVTEVVNAACKLAAVAAGVAPIVNWLVEGGEALVAVKVRLLVVPSGSLNVNVSVSPALGLVARSTEIEGGEPVGPVAVALVKALETPPSLNPKTEPATSSLSDTRVPAVGDADAT